jgi:hypothetical protein
LWFQIVAAVGAGVAVLLLVETFLTYRYSTTRLARDEGMLRAVEELSSLEHRLHRDHVDDVTDLERILREIVAESQSALAPSRSCPASGHSAGGTWGIRRIWPPHLPRCSGLYTRAGRRKALWASVVL